MSVEIEEFTECDACRKKAGSPMLCGGCLHNRSVIYDLKESLSLYKQAIKVVSDMLTVINNLK